MLGPVEIKIDQGVMIGEKRRSFKRVRYYSFQGIPYAKPPLGKLRFKAPQPARSWRGILDATSAGEKPPCYQRHMICFDEIVGQEDCLYLNVYTPEIRLSCGPYPVMVWIHGGAFVSGSGNTEMCQPEYLLDSNIVLVTFNYRVGILGFISFKDELLQIPGNAGLKDQVMVLKWVQHNIGRFNGDKRNVTIFGHGAGAASAHLHMLSPMSNGLFHKVIMQSGCALNPWVTGIFGTGEMVANALGISGDLMIKKLREISVEDLYSIQENLTNANMVDTKWFCSPIIEKQTNQPLFLTDEPLNIIRAGTFARVPIMIGYASREGIYWDIYNRLTTGKPEVIKDFTSAIPNNVNAKKGSMLSKTIADRIESYYYGPRIQSTRMGRNPRIKLMDPLYELITDTFFLRGIHSTVKNHCEISPSTPVYYYRFAMETKLNLFKNLLPKAHIKKYPGAAHGDDLGYFFKTFLSPALDYDDEEIDAIDDIVKLWTFFAKKGRPPSALCCDSKWTPASTKRLEFMEMNDDWKTGFQPDIERMRFWDVIYQNDIRTRYL